MTPPAKRMKSSDTSESGSNSDSDEECVALPIIFKAPGFQSDLRLQVFETIFHVHSVILKLHSEFFFKFLGSPEKMTLGVLIAPGFKYEWVTKVDDDGEGWGLVDARSVKDEKLLDTVSTSVENISEFKGNKKKETQAFKNLLHAIYNESYRLKDTDQLCLMTKLADYYFALPALSKSLMQPLMASNINIASETFDLIEVAAKLRHSPLYKDCIIYLAGRWTQKNCPTGDEIHQLGDPGYEIALRKRNEIYRSIADVQQLIFQIERGFTRVQQIKGFLRLQDDFLLPGYYHRLSDASYETSRTADPQHFRTHIHNAISPLVKDNLFFKQHYGPGDDLYENYFLCSYVDLGDLPWKWEESYCE